MLQGSSGPFDEDDLAELEPPPDRPFSREELDALVDEVLDEELERLRELEEEMRRPPN